MAAAHKLGHVTSAVDLITPKLASLHFYQLALQAPVPPAGSFDKTAAKRGQSVFNGEAKCANCHVPPLFTEPHDGRFATLGDVVAHYDGALPWDFLPHRRATWSST